MGRATHELFFRPNSTAASMIFWYAGSLAAARLDVRMGGFGAVLRGARSTHMSDGLVVASWGL
jgi:hypothetical protein